MKSTSHLTMTNMQENVLRAYAKASDTNIEVLYALINRVAFERVLAETETMGEAIEIMSQPLWMLDYLEPLPGLDND